jgi:hypothetical protein
MQVAFDIYISISLTFLPKSKFEHILLTGVKFIYLFIYLNWFDFLFFRIRFL